VANINCSSYRERLRDLGCIDLLIGLVRVRPLHPRISVLYNLTRSESVHTSFKESDFLSTVRELLAMPELSEGSRVTCVLAVAHVYGNEDDGVARRTLAAEDPSRQLVELLDSCVRGKGNYRGSTWTVEEVVHGVQSLARSSVHAEAMVKVRPCGVLMIGSRRSHDLSTLSE
jgi:hypothetical protein